MEFEKIVWYLGLLFAASTCFGESLTHLIDQAEAGDTHAQYQLAKAYASGNGVTKDESKAMMWWSRAAEHGLAEAENDLGYAYVRGEGIWGIRSKVNAIPV